MKKETLLFKLEQLRLKAEAENALPGTDMDEVRNIVRTEVIDTLLDYINQPGVREKVEEIPL